MKRMGVAACILLLALALTNGASCESYSRIGLSFGGVHIVGLYFERHFEDATVRAQVGYMIHALSLNLTALHYFDTSRHRPYIGFGYMKHINEMSLQGPNLFCVPIGIDAEVFGWDRSYTELQKEVNIIGLQLAAMNNLPTKIKQLESEATRLTTATSLIRREIKRQPTDEIRTMPYTDGSEHRFRVYKSKAGLKKPRRVTIDPGSGDKYIDETEPLD